MLASTTLEGPRPVCTCSSRDALIRPSLARRAGQATRCQAPRAQAQEGVAGWKQSLAAAGAAALLLVSPGLALANEFDLLSEPKPTTNYVIDDAGVLNRITRKDLGQQLQQLEIETGYRLELATVRKLEAENDAFAYGDRLIENWYKTREEGDKKGVLLLVTSGKDGALTGGPAFLKAVGDDLIDSIVSSNIPILTEQEKFNEAASSAVARIAARFSGREDPGAPTRAENNRVRTYKTKEETDKSRPATATIVAVLLGLAFIVPMLQYWGYTAKD